MPAATDLATARLTLRLPRASDEAGLLRYYCDNRAHFKPWVPLRTDDFFTPEAVRQKIAAMQALTAAGAAVYLLLCRPGSDEIVGECDFTNIVRGPFQACHLGFSIDARAQGQGLMREALETVIAFMFREHQLHRIMANYRPENGRSGRLLASLGFVQEGRAHAYLKIDGKWADHILTSRINPDMS